MHNFTGNVQDIYLWYEFGIDNLRLQQHLQVANEVKGETTKRSNEKESSVYRYGSLSVSVYVTMLPGKPNYTIGNWKRIYSSFEIDCINDACSDLLLSLQIPIHSHLHKLSKMNS